MTTRTATTAVAGSYCLPLCACMAYSLTADGRLSTGDSLAPRRPYLTTRGRAGQTKILREISDLELDH